MIVKDSGLGEDTRVYVDVATLYVFPLPPGGQTETQFRRAPHEAAFISPFSFSEGERERERVLADPLPSHSLLT